MEILHQGDILKIEKIKHPVLVVSKDFFNSSGEIIGCPIIGDSVPGPLHIRMAAEEIEGSLMPMLSGVYRAIWLFWYVDTLRCEALSGTFYRS